jgi:hypothetical protein
MADENWGLDYILFSDLTYTQLADQGGFISYFIEEPIPTIRHMDYDFGSFTPGKEIPQVGFERSVQRSHQAPVDTERGYALGANEHMIHLTKGVATLDLTKLRIWFLRDAPHLLRFTTSTYPTTSSLRIDAVTALTLGRFILEKDHYRWSTISCKTVPSAAAPQNKEFVISTFREDTHPNWDITTQTVHGLSAGSTIWESVPFWPRAHHDLLAWVAAERCMVKGGDRPGRAAVLEEAASLWDDFIQRVHMREIQTPRMVHRTGWI